MNEKIYFYFQKFMGIVPASAVIVWFLHLQISARVHSNRFFKEAIATVVINSKPFYTRSVQFELKNGMMLYYMPRSVDIVIIGDSISKKQNTFMYTVYRKDGSNTYKYFRLHDYNQF